MQHTTLAGLDVSRLGLGTMGMSAFYTGAGSDDAGSARTIERALDLGVTFFDTAEGYGPANEELLGRAVRARRDEVVLASKWGLISHLPGGDEREVDGRPENLRAAVEGSLRRLGTDRVDLYYQHRMDPAVPIEDTVGAVKELIDAGKIRAYGLSEAAPETIRRAHAVHPVTAVQTEYSLWTRDPEAEILPLLRELGIGFVPYSPLGRGFLTGALRTLDHLDERDYRRINPRFQHLAANLRIVDTVEQVARSADATAAQVALAWVLAQGEGIAPIPGTKRVERLEENLAADDLVLPPDQLAVLDAIEAPIGDRYEDMSLIDR